MADRKLPRIRTDDEAEALLSQDLSDLDFSQFKPMHFEFEKKEARSTCACHSRFSMRLRIGQGRAASPTRATSAC